MNRAISFCQHVSIPSSPAVTTREDGCLHETVSQLIIMVQVSASGKATITSRSALKVRLLIVSSALFFILILQKSFIEEVHAMKASTIIQTGKPFLIYGTAWKKQDTARLVSEAIHAGFRFIDTACQPKHYHEPGVGEGWYNAAHELGLKREDLFLQTKFTSLDGQDPSKVPYDVDASLEDQIRQSLNQSLINLHTSYIDSLVLHSPFDTLEETMTAWRVMETFVDTGKVIQLGISNCYDAEFFKLLYSSSRIKPHHVQNRFYANSGFDVELRAFCKENGILYQSFWTLTANRQALGHPVIKMMATNKGLTPQTLMYAFMMRLGHTPLDGTTNPSHMAEDIAIMERIQGGELILDDEEIIKMAKILGIPQ